jgi:dienelactone hydrolase
MTNVLVTSTRVLRAVARTAIFVLKVLPMLPSRPLDWVTPSPVIERVRYPTSRGSDEGDLYRPSSGGPHPGVVVCLGVVPVGADHPQVPRLGAALARSGFAALLYWSPAMRDLRLDPEDIEGIATAYRWLIERPGVDPARSGLLGTCVGGSFALMAAAHPSIRDGVAFVAAFAPYSSMWSLARDIASSTRVGDDGRERWEVDPLTRAVYARTFTANLESEEAELLRGAFADRAGQNQIPDRDDLSEGGRTVASPLIASDVEDADAALNRLPAGLQQRLTTMSPTSYLPDIHAPLVVLAHDRDDPVIPIGESRRLRAALAGRAGVRYTEFVMFKHLDPTKVTLSRLRLPRELARFYLALYPIFRRAVGR